MVNIYSKLLFICNNIPMIRQIKIQEKITDRTEDSIKIYLNEIAKIRQITEEEEAKLAKRIRRGDVSALHELCKANLRFVVSVAKQYQYQYQWFPLSDLINQGNEWLIIAAKKFDEKKWFKFISYAVRRIRQKILEGLAEEGRIVRIPLNRIWDLNNISKTSNELEQELCREPISREIAEILNKNPRTIDETIAISKKASSLDSLVSDDPTAGTHIDFLENEEKDAADYGSNITSLKEDIDRTLSILSDKQKETITLHFGIGCDPKTVDEIAKILGIKSNAVRKAKERAIHKLQRLSTLEHLKQYLW